MNGDLIKGYTQYSVQMINSMKKNKIHKLVKITKLQKLKLIIFTQILTPSYLHRVSVSYRVRFNTRKQSNDTYKVTEKKKSRTKVSYIQKCFFFSNINSLTVYYAKQPREYNYQCLSE